MFEFFFILQKIERDVPNDLYINRPLIEKKRKLAFTKEFSRTEQIQISDISTFLLRSNFQIVRAELRTIVLWTPIIII